MRTPKTTTFYLKRVLRIYPPLLVCLVLTVIGMRRVSVAAMPEYLDGAWTYVLNNLLMRPYYNLPGVFIENPYQYAVNGSLWTLPVELMCFFVLPLCLTAAGRSEKYGNKLSFLFSGVLAVILIVLKAKTPVPQLIAWGTDWVDSLRVIVCFFMGASYALLPEVSLRRYCKSEIALALILIVCCLGSRFPNWVNYFVVPYIVISIGIDKRGVLRSFCAKHDYAYGIFLWGFPMQQLVMYAYIHLHLPVTLPPLVLLMVALPITVFMGIMQAKFIEEPVAKLVKKL